MKKPSAGEKRAPRAALWASLVAAVVIAAPISRFRGLGLRQGAARNFFALSDGFFVAGALVGGIGLLTWVGSTGFFDMISYGLQGLWHRLTPFLHPSGQTSFYDYKLARAEKRKSPSRAMILVGLACIALAGLFLALYYRFR